VQLVRRGHFRSRDKDGHHTIRHAVVENLMALSFTESELRAIKVDTPGIGILDVFSFCDRDLDPMTFIYKLDPYCLEIYRMYKYELLCQGFPKLPSDRQIDRFD